MVKKTVSAAPSTSIDFDTYLLSIGFKHVPKTSGFKSGIIAQGFINKKLGISADAFIDTVHGDHRVVLSREGSRGLKTWKGQYVSDFKIVVDSYLKGAATLVTLTAKSIKKADEHLRYVFHRVARGGNPDGRRIVELAGLERGPTKKMKSRLQAVLDALFNPVKDDTTFDEAGFVVYDNGTVTGEFNFTVTEKVCIYFEMSIKGDDGGLVILDVQVHYDDLPEEAKRFQCKGGDLEGMTLIADACEWLKVHPYFDC